MHYFSEVSINQCSAIYQVSDDERKRRGKPSNNVLKMVKKMGNVI